MINENEERSVFQFGGKFVEWRQYCQYDVGDECRGSTRNLRDLAVASAH